MRQTKNGRIAAVGGANYDAKRWHIVKSAAGVATADTEKLESNGNGHMTNDNKLIDFGNVSATQ